MQKEPITKKSYNNILAILDDLKLNQKPKNLIEIERARELGDLKENAEYHAAKEEQANLDKQIAKFSQLILDVYIVDISTLSHNKVNFGSCVTLLNLNDNKKITYTIVNSFDSNPAKGYISYLSPLARAILNKEVKQEIEVELPGRLMEFEILSIKADDTYV